MRKLSKLIITRMEIHDVPCTVAALIEEERIVEVRLESDQEKSILGNIYTGQVENIDPISRRLLSRSDLERDVTILLRKRRELFFPQEEKETDHCGREMNFWSR